MAVLGGGGVLMSEVPLYSGPMLWTISGTRRGAFSYERGVGISLGQGRFRMSEAGRGAPVQGYLAQKKTPSSRTRQ